MTANKRKTPRHELRIDVQLAFLAYNPTPATTRDVSEGGMFLEVKDASEYEIGEIIHLRYTDPFHGNADTMIDATVVRVASDGIGITFPE